MRVAVIRGCVAGVMTFAVSMSAAAGVTHFGPKSYTVVPGRPQTFHESVAVSDSQRCDGKAAFILVVQNAGVDSAIISVNSVVLVPESAFKPKAPIVEVPVLLGSSNSLQVVLKGGKPGGSLAISIRKEIEEAAAGIRQYKLAEKRQTFTDTVAIGDPGSKFALFVETGNSDGTLRPKSFSVRVNGSEILTEKDLLGASHAARAAVSLQAVNAVTADVSGDRGDILTVALKRELTEAACGPRVSIETPAEIATITDSHVVVTGTATGPTDLGITVNDRAAEIDLAHAGTVADPFRWTAVVTSLDPGPVTLEAIARTGRGAEAKHSRAITFAPQPQKLSLLPAVQTGMAPFAASFNIAQDLATAITKYEVDLDGDGTFELTAESAPESLSSTYATPGVYRATLRGLAKDGVLHTSIAYVFVQSPATVDAILQSRWRELRDALAAQDVEGAVSIFTFAAQEKYRRVFTNLFAQLPRIAAEMQPAGMLSLHGEFADYLVLRVEDGRTRGYHLTFMRDENGLWRVADF